MGRIGFPEAIRLDASTSITLDALDAQQRRGCTASTAVSVTVPANSSVPYEIGQVLWVYQLGDGTVTLNAAGGVTLRFDEGLSSEGKDAQPLRLIKVDADEWLVLGGVAP